MQKLPKSEALMANTGPLSMEEVSAGKTNLGKIALTNPVCTEVGDETALKTVFSAEELRKHCCLIGWDQIRRGVTIKLTIDDD